LEISGPFFLFGNMPCVSSWQKLTIHLYGVYSRLFQFFTRF
jgi:hypothetical protein